MYRRIVGRSWQKEASAMKQIFGILTGFLTAWSWLGLPAVAPAQSALERIEGQIRGPAGSAATPTVPGNPAAAPIPGPAAKAKSADPPYLGAVADDSKDRGRGVRVLEVRPGGPAGQAGLRPQDLIIGAASAQVRQMSDLTAVLDLLAPGDRLELDIVRGVQPQKVVVTLGRRTAPKAEVLPPPPKEPTPLSATEPPLLEAPAGPVLTPPPSGPPPAPDSASARFEQLQRRIEQLEQRVQELERALAEAKRKP
jgi:hypothetical protein